MKTVIVKCKACGTEFPKEEKEVNRWLRKGRDYFFCSIGCGLSVAKQDDFSHLKGIMNNAKKRSVKKKLDFNLTLEFLAALAERQQGKCAYTGIEMLFPKKGSAPINAPDAASLDRIDSSKGYTQDNVELVTLFVNYGKNGFSKSEIIDFIYAIKAGH